MTTIGWLPAPVEDLFGPEATAEESYEVLTVDVPPTSWLAALEAARDELGCTYFDWLSAVDEPGTGFRVAAHVAALSPVRRLLVRTTVPHEAPTLPSAVGVYAGAAWHERETHEMFGVAFTDHPALDHLLLPDNFEGHPLRKDFVLAARVAKAWPGAKEPGESEHGGPKRRQMLPPGVPDPNEWGPLKGQLPPAPARPARGAGRTAGERPARAAGERPVRRARTASEGSAGQADAPAESAAPTTGTGAVRRARTASEGSVSQQGSVSRPGAASATEGSAGQTAAPGAAGPSTEPGASPAGTGTPATPRRSRSAGEGSASQRADVSADTTSEGAGDGPETAATTAPSARRARSASEGSASQRPGTGTAPAGPRRSRSASDGSASQRPAADAATPDTAPSGTPESGTPASDAAVSGAAPTSPTAPRSPDAPWHHARPAFDDPEPKPTSAPERANQASEAGQAGQPEPGEATTAKHEDPAGSTHDRTDPADSADPADPEGGPQ
ncbi:NADH-quinone oxidoreductase subunit C [Streptomyces viridochromogenes]|uniref:NADH-quinone oxidoreductase subunit C n=1 Tax=Streptomyces viridochromogenes TaxID=1938 RepID=UPI0007C65D6B|nr:NADH-quinone oxidoreductase subunit C [Streptomyces viridochromogenes]